MEPAEPIPHPQRMGIGSQPEQANEALGSLLGKKEAGMDVLIGLLAIIVGVAIALAGLRYFYLLLPIWGFVAGFVIGGALVTALFGDGFLSTTLGIVVGLGLGLVFALMSYFYWYFSVVLAAAVAGGILGASLFGAIGVDREWILFIIAVAFGVATAFIALMLNLPVYMVVVNTALAGSAVAIGGVLMVLDKFDREDLGTGALWERIEDHWFLWLIWIAGAIVGMMAQLATREANILPEERWKAATPGAPVTKTT